jgi:hypothetical protein
MSTNKVYGDGPNRLNLVEKETRWDYADEQYVSGIRETFSIDSSMHSIFGASKVAADIMTQEYGRYFQMPSDLGCEWALWYSCWSCRSLTESSIQVFGLSKIVRLHAGRSVRRACSGAGKQADLSG